MITIHKLNKRQVNKIFSSTSTIALLFALVGLLSTSSLAVVSSNGLHYAFAADKEFDIDVDIEKDSIKRGDTQDITVAGFSNVTY